MSIADGNSVNATYTNTRVASKVAANTFSGIQTLSNVDSASGDSVSNLQAAVNGATTTVEATTTISASGAITLDQLHRSHVVPVVGNAGSVSASTTPFGTSGTRLNGTVVHLIGTNTSQTVTFSNNNASNGMILNGDAALGAYDMLSVVWVLGLLRWVEISRNF